MGHHRRGRASRSAYPCRITTSPRSLNSVDGSSRTGDSNVGTFTPRGLAASSLGHCSTPVPITRDVAVPPPSFYIGRGTRGITRTDSPRAGSSLAWLLACLRVARCCLGPRGAGDALVDHARTAWPAPAWKGSAPHQNERFSGLRVRFRATFPSPRYSCVSSSQHALTVVTLLSG